MRRIKITVAYDGTDYCGWQVQPNGRTIEAVLNDAIRDTFKENQKVKGASRTDAGVHAHGNVAVFDIEGKIPAEKAAYALNKKLPRDIVVTHSEEVPCDFHPRYRRTRKTYEYKILNAESRDPLRSRYTCYFRPKLDIGRMREGAACLIGKHDFASFCAARSQAKTTIRTIECLEITKLDDEITIRITGDGFLYNMVRMIAGVLMRVGTGFYPVSEVPAILDRRERGYARPTAAACGLTLMSVEYPPDRCAWAVTPEAIAYHDKEWCVPVHDDRKLFEFLILEGQQAGLSWNTILKKRENMRQAFSGFDPEQIAAYSEADMERLMQNSGIIRNRRKLDALVKNARAFLCVCDEYGSFDAYIWHFTDGFSIDGHRLSDSEVPASTDLSDEMSRDMKKRGFSFVGTTICYSFMQAVGIVNDHTTSCFRYGEVKQHWKKRRGSLPDDDETEE